MAHPGNPRPVFGQPSAATATAIPTKKKDSLRKRRRFGRFSKNKSSKNGSSPEENVDASRADTATTTAEEMSWQDLRYVNDFSEGVALPQGSAASSNSTTQYKFDDSAKKLNLLPSKAQQKATGSSGSPRSASGYISEATDVSEFSFDRVTVGTNEISTGMSSSSVNWAFAENPTMRALGGNQITPYVGLDDVGTAVDATVAQPSSPPASLPVDMSDRVRRAIDDLSLSSCSEDDTPITGSVPSWSSQSVVSKICEDVISRRRGGTLAQEAEKDGVRALLAGAEPHAVNPPRKTPSKTSTRGASSRTTVTRSTSVARAETSEKPRGDSVAMPEPAGLCVEMTAAYAEFKKARNNKHGPGVEKPSLLSELVEDLQFCTLWFCGVDTTDDGVGREEVLIGKRKGSDDKVDTLLGRVISCSPQCALL